MAGNLKQMTAFDHGSAAARLSTEAREAYKQTQKAKAEGRIRAAQSRLQAKASASALREQEFREELMSRGNISQQANKQALFVAFVEAFALVLCAFGELAYTKWMIEPFGIGDRFALWSIAIAILIVSLETVDRFLKWHRAAFPEYTNYLFLTISSICLFTVCLMILEGGEIRAALYPITSLFQDPESPDIAIRQAEQFYSGKSAGFMWLMVALTATFTLMAGATYHDVKHRIPSA